MGKSSIAIFLCSLLVLVLLGQNQVRIHNAISFVFQEILASICVHANDHIELDCPGS
jgi:uncharacterized membrane protein